MAVGVIFSPDRDNVLISQRPAHLAHGGLWEFPGGKLQQGERTPDALRRELREELDIDVVNSAPLIRVTHDYDRSAVELDVRIVHEWRGKARGREGQLVRWVPVERLGSYRFPAANLPIIRTLQLPPLYLITPDLPDYDEAFFTRLRKLLAAGVRLLQFRNHSVTGKRRIEVIRRILAMCNTNGARLIINGTPEEAVAVAAHGVHLNADRAGRMRRRPLASGFLVGASCHSLSELQNACALGLDFATYGPVKVTGSHPGVRGKGWKNLKRAAGDCGIPVYALGGMTVHDLKSAREAGAWGVGIISSIWNAPDADQQVSLLRSRGPNA